MEISLDVWKTFGNLHYIGYDSVYDNKDKLIGYDYKLVSDAQKEKVVVRVKGERREFSFLEMVSIVGVTLYANAVIDGGKPIVKYRVEADDIRAYV